jgi:aminocarboxymuconate-semialdehyde decarboxylase
MACGLEFFKVPHVMFASDFPFDAEGGAFMVRETVRGLDQLRLNATDKQAILQGNILAFLGLEESNPGKRS